MTVDLPTIPGYMLDLTHILYIYNHHFHIDIPLDMQVIKYTLCFD